MFNCPSVPNQTHKVLTETPPDLKHMKNKFFFVTGDWEFSATERKAAYYKKWFVKNWWAPVKESFLHLGTGTRSEEGELAEFYIKRNWKECLEPLNLWRWGIQPRRPDTAPPEIRSWSDFVERVVPDSLLDRVQQDAPEKEGIQMEEVVPLLPSSLPLPLPSPPLKWVP